MATKVYRTIDYYYVKDSAEYDRHTGEDLRAIFEHAAALADENNRGRYLKVSTGFVTVDNLRFGDGTIFGRAIKVNTQELPELMDTESAVYRDVEAGEAEGIIQVAHFLLSLNHESAVLALESVQSGVNIGTFNFFLQLFAQKVGRDFLPALPLIIRDTLDDVVRRVVRIKSFEVAIHRDRIAEVADLDAELFDFLAGGQNYGESDVVRAKLQFDLRGGRIPEEMMGKFRTLVQRLREEVVPRNVFDRLDIYGEDGDNNLRSTVFDLIEGRLKSKVYVPRRERSSSLETDAMFDAMGAELRNTIT